jgi:hypothetical protein
MAQLPDSRPWQSSDELDGIAVGTPEEERKRAKDWMDVAAQHLRNEEFWRGEAQRLYRLCKLAHRELATVLMKGCVFDFTDVITILSSRVDGKMAQPEGLHEELVKTDPGRAAKVNALLDTLP